VESWGRKKRSIGSSAAAAGGGGGPKDRRLREEGGKQVGDDMTLSREIVVLDLKEKAAEGAEKEGATSRKANSDQSMDELNLLAADGLGAAQRLSRSSGSSLGPGDESQASGSQQSGSATSGDDTHSASSLHCLSSQSLLLLICSIGLFFVLYVCLVACFFARRDPKISAIRQQYH